MRNIYTALVLLLSFPTFSQTPTIGTSVQGDFDGDGKKEFAFSVQTKEAVGNPMEDGTSAEFAVNFSTDKIISLDADCCRIILVNEGDLNNDGNDELSIYQEPINGNVYSMETFTFKKGKWITIVPYFLIPPRIDYLTDDDIKNLVFNENGSIHYLDTDMSTEDMKQFKVKVN